MDRGPMFVRRGLIVTKANGAAPYRRWAFFLFQLVRRGGYSRALPVLEAYVVVSLGFS